MEERAFKHPSMMFLDPATEAAFLNSNREKLLFNGFALGVLANLCTPVLWVTNLVATKWYEGPDADFIALRSYLMAGFTAFFLVLSLLVRVKCFTRLFSSRLIECGTTVNIFLFMLGLCLLDYPVLSRLMSDHDIVDRGHASTMPLTLITMLTVAHTAMPIRWIAMVWLDVGAALCCIGYVVTARVDGRLWISVLSIMIAFCMSVGLRIQEQSQRSLFIAVVHERSLRVQAEFQLQQCPPVGAVSDKGKLMSLDYQPSAPSTTFTGGLFRIEEDLPDGHKTELLEAIANVGEDEHWLIQPEELQVELDEVIGKGGFGIVCAGTYHRAPVAVKVPKQDEANMLADIVNELGLLRRVRHEHIVLFYGAYIQAATREVMLVLQRVRGPQLDKLITDPDQAPDDAVRTDLLLCVAQALAYLHSRRPCIVHGDLKPGNILVEHDGARPRPKLLDFGLARAVTRRATCGGGTMRYSAPEVIRHVTGRHQKLSPSSDVFSFGRLLYFVAMARRPLQGSPEEVFLLKSKQRAVPELQWEPLTILGARWQPLVLECTQHSPESRPDIHKAMNDLGNGIGESTMSSGVEKQPL